jgi:hypothetical protein
MEDLLGVTCTAQLAVLSSLQLYVISCLPTREERSPSSQDTVRYRRFSPDAGIMGSKDVFTALYSVS